MGLKNYFLNVTLYSPGTFVVLVLLFWGGARAQDATVDSDSSRSLRKEYQYIRGIENDKKSGSRLLRFTVNTVLFIPRTITDGLLFSTGFGAHLVDDSKFIEKAEDFFFIYEKRIGWFPVLSFSNGSRTAYGATIFYSQKPFGIAISGKYRNEEIWATKVNLNYAFLKGQTVWRIKFTARIKNRDDYKFFGLGSEPLSDPRNAFKEDAKEEFGVFVQRLSKLQLVLGMRSSHKWQLFYTTFFQERKFKNPDAHDEANIEQTFEINRVPGATRKGKQFYNEFAARYDTRKFQGQISPGARVEGYAGLSMGIAGDHSRFLRSGVDAALYLPVIKQTRLIVPRIVFDMVDNLNDDVPISFAEYPRQLAFRGVSSTSLLRSDKISLLSSLEYQWPLTYNLGGHLFADHLMVSNSFSNFTTSNAPYAVGFGIDLHGADSELARLSISNGSEGWRFLLTVGLSSHTSDRSKWQ